MSRAEQERIAEAIRRQNELYDAGEVDQAFWLGQQERLKALQATEPKLTQKQMGELVGQTDRWVSTVLAWDSRARELPDWRSGSNKRSTVVENALAKKPQEHAEAIAKAMEDPEVAQAVAAKASAETLQAVEVAASTESYMRKRAAKKPPPADAASHQLGGVGPQATANQLFNETMEPLISRIHRVIGDAKLRWTKYGFRLALTDVDEFPELDKQVQEIGQMYAELLDAYDAAKEAKRANEEEGARTA